MADFDEALELLRRGGRGLLPHLPRHDPDLAGLRPGSRGAPPVGRGGQAAREIEGLIAVRGRVPVLEFFNGLAEQFAGHTISIDDAIEAGDRLICFVTHRVTRLDGESGQFKAVHDWCFRDGQAVSLHEIADTLAFAIFTGQAPAPAVA